MTNKIEKAVKCDYCSCFPPSLNVKEDKNNDCYQCAGGSAVTGFTACMFTYNRVAPLLALPDADADVFMTHFYRLRPNLSKPGFTSY